MGFKMNGSPAKTGSISGTAGHASALKMVEEQKAASALKKVNEDGSVSFPYENKKTKKKKVGEGTVIKPEGKKMSNADWAKGVKKSGGTLNELVSARKKHKKGSAEYAEIQNKINSSLGSKKVHKVTKENKKGETVDVKPKGTTTRKSDGANVTKGLGAQKGKTLTFTEKAAEKEKINKANTQIKEGKAAKDKNKRDEGQLAKAKIKRGDNNAKTGTMLSRALAKRKAKRNERQLAKRKEKDSPADMYKK